MPMFFIGTMICDFENEKDNRPLDIFRNLSWPLALVRNVVLLTLFLIYSSFNQHGCYYSFDEPCSWMNVMSFDSNLPWWFCNYIGAISIFLLALTSPVLQWILSTPPIQFLGQVSYMLYLIHQLIVEWAMNDFYVHYKDDQEVGHHYLCVLNFVMWTPVLLILSWLLTLAIDTPAKDFAYECDIQSRIEPPKSKKLSSEDDGVAADPRPPWWQFVLYSWKIWIFVIYLVIIITVAEVFNAYHGQPKRYFHEERGF